MFYCCLFHLCFPPNVHHFCRRILNSIVLKFCIPVRISQNGIVLIDSFPIIRIFRAFVNPFLLFGLHFSLFFFAYNLPVCHLPAQENVLYSMYLSPHRQLGEFSSYQLSVQSSVRMHHRCAARVLYAGHKEIHYENEKRKRTKKNHPGTPEQD